MDAVWILEMRGTSNYSKWFWFVIYSFTAAVDRIEVVHVVQCHPYMVQMPSVASLTLFLKKPSEQLETAFNYSYELPTEGDDGAIHKASAYIGGSLIENKLLANLVLEGVDQRAWRSEQSIYKNTDAAEKRKRF